MKLKNRSILRKLFNYMMLFGIMMGIVFPVYANFFVEWKPGFFIYFVAGCILAGVIVGVVSYWFVKVILIKELLKVSDVASNLSKKNIAIELDIKSNDAVGEIADGFNSVIRSLNEFITETKNITTAAHVIGGNNGKAGSNGSIVLLNNTIEKVNSNTQEISKLSDNIRNEILEVQSVVNKSNKDLHAIDKSVSAFSDLMKRLMDQSLQIDKIIKVVNDFATQTNLLALNASIEASKAGEAGKSFAVVAGEVRGLSAHIAESVVQISQTISSLNKDLEKANELNQSISHQFNENLKENMYFTEIVEKVDQYSASNLEENFNLKGTVDNLNETVDVINGTFKSFYSSVSQLNEAVSEYNTLN
ncbi:hypothetical protein E9993_08495 [Labilibacter sediminis]|nr:hypothetical protein E9993_08495 [Labilibacter sediminis]